MRTLPTVLIALLLAYPVMAVADDPPSEDQNSAVVLPIERERWNPVYEQPIEEPPLSFLRMVAVDTEGQQVRFEVAGGATFQGGVGLRIGTKALWTIDYIGPLDGATEDTE